MKNIKISKKTVKIVAVVLAVAIVGGIFVKSRFSAPPAQEDLSLARTVVLEKGKLDSTVNVSGVVQSGTVSTVTTALAAKVISVDVKVGDKVKKGDVICTLDASDIDKQIADKEKELSEAKDLQKTEVEKIQKQLDRAKENQSEIKKTQDKLVESARSTYDAAKEEVKNLRTGYDLAKAAYDSAAAAVDQTKKSLEQAEQSRTSAYAAWEAAGLLMTDATTGTELPAYTAYQAAEAAVQEAEKQLATAKEVYDYDSCAAAFTAAQAAYDEKNAAMEAAESSKESAKSAQKSTVKDAENTVSDLADQLEEAKKKSGSSTKDSELEDLKEKKKDTVLKAESDGEITELNVTVGAIPKDTLTLAKIQSTEELVLHVTILEADINRVETGLPVRITADSIKEPVTGTLERISPTAETGEGTAGGGSSEAGYGADIRIAPSSDLHIGSKAKGEIVLSTKEDVFTVPIDAVGTGDNGGAVIKEMAADGTTKDIEVTTGDQNDYYIEISGDSLTEGMEILADANWQALVDSAAAMEGGY